MVVMTYLSKPFIERAWFPTSQIVAMCILRRELEMRLDSKVEDKEE
jgi:hypothetical protein